MANRIGIDVVVDEDLQGLQKTGTELTKFSRTSIQNIDQLTSHTAKLQAEYAKLQAELAQNQRALDNLARATKQGTVAGAEAVRMNDQRIQRQRELQRAVQITGRQYSAASAQLGSFNRLTADSQQKLALISSQLGIQLPGSIGKFIAQTQGAQRALSAAFNATLLVGFATTIGAVVIPALLNVYNKLTDIGEKSRELLESVQRKNRELILADEAKVHQRIVAINRELAAPPRTISKIGHGSNIIAPEDTEHRAELQKELLDLQDTLTALQKRRLGSVPSVPDIRTGADFSTLPPNQLGVPPSALPPPGTAISFPEARDRKDPSLLGPGDAAAKRAAEYQYQRDLEEARQDDIFQANLRKQQEYEAERLKITQQAELDRMRLIDQEASAYEGMFRRITAGAHGFRDILGNISQEIADRWIHQTFRMLAAWNVGGGGVSGQAGGAGSIFGGAPLGLPSLGPGGTPPFIGNFTSGSGFSGAANFTPVPAGTSGLGLGIVSTRTVPTLAQTLDLPATTPPGDVAELLSGGVSFGALSRVSPAAFAFAGLSGLSLVGNRNRIFSGVGGFFGGGALGLAAGGIGALGGLAIGSFLGPIGALAGLGLGLIFGGGGQDKVHDTQIQQSGEQLMFQALEDYRHRRIDYQAAVNQVEQAYQQMVAQFVRSESRRIPEIERANILEQIRSTEDARIRRGDFLGGLAVPEFASGGFVGTGTSAGIPAKLHPGEYVMTADAVSRLGVHLLEGLNRGSAAMTAGGVGDAETYALVRVNKREWDQAVSDSLPRIILQGGAASRLLRG